jgi:hypothetical protein
MDTALWLQATWQIATWQEVVADHLASFLIGVGIGFVMANRYRIIRRNGDK